VIVDDESFHAMSVVSIWYLAASPRLFGQPKQPGAFRQS
jgi:hypothetical protein